MTREFVFERATKNMYRYAEDPTAVGTDVVAGPPAQPPIEMCGTIYVNKAALPTKPVRIRVTIEEVKVQP